ncbi:hypothetical protein KKE75_04545 [Patescibacteria group bacterium]|nr:hypothetical protein [Patescibacteria group bacterium]
MSKKFVPAEQLLLGIYFIDEFLDSIVGAGSRAYRSRRLGLWTPRNYKGSLLRQNIYRLLKTGDLEKRMVKGEPTLIISRGGKRRLSRNFSYFKMQNQHWDGYWRLVVFDISEKNRIKRDALRYKLQELGFGMWQKSIYISPFSIEEDMNEYLKERNLFGEAFVLTAKHQLIGDARELADRVWHLDSISNRYENLLEKLESGEKLKKICRKYIDLLLIDPCLPRELLPNDWVADKVKKILGQRIKDFT